MIVDKGKAKDTVPVYGLSYPLESGLNNSTVVERYFRGKMPSDYKSQIYLEEFYPELYRKFDNNFEGSNNSKEKSGLAKILNFFKFS